LNYTREAAHFTWDSCNIQTNSSSTVG